MGGTFDPPHMGHLVCAEMARDACGLDAVAFIPANRQPFKLDAEAAPVEDRLRMCRAAVAGNPAFCVSDVEAARGGVTYTIDTVRGLGRMFDGVEPVLIVGRDCLETLDAWKDARELARLVRFACVARPGYAADAARLAALEAAGFDIACIDVPTLDLSSSEIRARIARGDSIRYLVSDGVRAYIEEHGLYARGGE